jgi:hypothetical protein
MGAGAVLGLLYLPPVIAAVLASNPKVQEEINRLAPTNAGFTIQDTTNLHGLTISPWARPRRPRHLGCSRAPCRRADVPAAR